MNVIYRRKLRKRIVEILNQSGLFNGIYDSRVSQLDPNGDNFPCALVYCNSDNNDVGYQRATHNTIRESTVSLVIQIVNHVDNVDSWPDAVELLEYKTIELLNSIDSKRKIDDHIKWFTLSDSDMSIDVAGNTPEASVSLTYTVEYNEDISYMAEDDFERLGYTVQSTCGDDIAKGVIELPQDEEVPSC